MSILWMHRLLTAAALLALAAPLDAQTASAPALKAAFVYNFATFAEWPTDATPAGPLTICVLGDEVIALALDGTVKGRAIGGRTVVVSRVKAGALLTCHVLYLTGFDAKRSQEIIDGLKNAPVLTVSDQHRFAQAGGIAGMFVEGGKMRFAINVEAAQRARLHLSSRLLSLATIVKDDHAHP